MDDDIKKIAALIGHQQAQEKRVSALIDAFQKESTLLSQQTALLAQVIDGLDSASGKMTDTIRKSVATALNQVEQELKQTGLAQLLVEPVAALIVGEIDVAHEPLEPRPLHQPGVVLPLDVQWLGGVGFIVLAVAVLPYLNVGGMKLFQTESSDKSDKDSPRAANVAKNIVIVYLVLSLLCCIAYWLCGMSLFEAINHAMTTLSTGGFSTSDASLAHFSNSSQWVASAFMFLGGLPFLLYVQTLRRRQLVLFQDAQVQGFFWLVVITTLMMSLWIWYKGVFPLQDAIRISMFNIVSVLTTTGYGLTDFGLWSHFTTVLFIFLMLVGACSGSTSGGMKIFRFQVASALFQKQARQLMHPAGVFPQKYNGRPVSDHIVRSIVAFVLGYAVVIVVSAALLGLLGLTPLEAISGSITAISNVGPGLGPVIGPLGNFASLPDAAKWILAFDMMLGRLEILTVAVLFFPSFWKN